MWDLIVSVPDHCLSFNFGITEEKEYFTSETQHVRRCPPTIGKRLNLSTYKTQYLNYAFNKTI